MTRIALLSIWLLALVYPLAFFSTYRKTIVQSFERFNMGMTCSFALVSVLLIWSSQPTATTRVTTVLWLLCLLLALALSWGMPKINEWLFAGPSVLGALAFWSHFYKLFMPMPLSLLVAILGSLALAGAIYTEVLGHWYLNVPGLNVSYLKRSTWIYALGITLQGLVVLFWFGQKQVIIAGDLFSLWALLLSFDGLFLWFALIFALVFPLLMSFMVLETIKLRNTQSATGILYVVLASMLIGDLFFKHYVLIAS